MAGLEDNAESAALILDEDRNHIIFDEENYDEFNVNGSIYEFNGTDLLSTVSNSSDAHPPEFESLGLFYLLLTFCLATVLGNTLVIMAVIRERTLHTATNYFITSLAVADSLVGLTVMPFSATFEAMGQQWIFGPDLCDVWHSFDVLASTASIMNLCVISIDRYWAINNPMSYPHKMTDAKAALLICFVWVLSSSISFPAIAWWRMTAQSEPGPYECPFTEDVGYLVFSSIVSFYGPLAVMVFTYYRVYKAAMSHMKSIKAGGKQLTNGENGGDMTLRIHVGGGGTAKSAMAAAAMLATPGGHLLNKSVSNGKSILVSHPKTNFSISRKMHKFSKEKKAAKTLGTVMGVFIICWLPFFLANVVSGICADCISPVVFSIVNWLGWINSGMNPIIYACFSKDFRR